MEEFMARKWYVLGVLLLGSCGNPEREEAVRLASELARQQMALSARTSDEAETFASIKQWAGYVSFLGADGDSQQRADNFTQKVVSTHDHVSLALVSLDTLQLKHAFTQTVRGEVVSQLRTREQFLSETGSLLRGARDAFPRMGWSQFPSQIRDISAKLDSYQSPPDPFADALRQLREKYTITDQDLADATRQGS